MSTTAIVTLLCGLAAAPAVDVTVVPIGGTAPADDRARATSVLVDTLRGLDGVRPIPVDDAEKLLGPEGARALGACADDACLVAATRVIRASVLATGTLDAGGGAAPVLRLRLVDTSSAARVLVRVTRDLSAAAGSHAFEAAIGDAAAELFPDQAARSFGVLVVTGAPPGAAIVADGKVVADAPTGALPAVRLRRGRHAIRV
ncbi:hypothetical protein L6R52_43425, partial [Myxococcota bacterium]|nr:hypothetical protein [Myxococcota bacterium]